MPWGFNYISCRYISCSNSRGRPVPIQIDNPELDSIEEKSKQWLDEQVQKGVLHPEDLEHFDQSDDPDLYSDTDDDQEQRASSDDGTIQRDKGKGKAVDRSGEEAGMNGAGNPGGGDEVEDDDQDVYYAGSDMDAD